MVYDCFTFYNELDLLLLRLNILNDKVDFFVISESSKTHSNQSKPFLIEANWDNFAAFHKKIIYIKVDFFPEYVNSWTYENHQRNMLINGLSHCKDNDLIMLSDLDEIPNPGKIPERVPLGEVSCFIQEMYFYYANYFKANHILWEGGTKICSFQTIRQNLIDERYVKYNDLSFPKYLNRNATLTKIRLYRRLGFIFPGGWHLSYLGGVRSIMAKLDATSHQEINTVQINNERFIENCLSKGIDILDTKVKCYARPLYEMPDLLKMNLDERFFTKSSRQMSSLNYQFRTAIMLISIFVRGKLRRLFP